MILWASSLPVGDNKAKERRFTDSDVCRPFLLGICINDLFINTVSIPLSLSLCVCVCMYKHVLFLMYLERQSCHKYLNLISYWTQYKFPLVFLSYNKSSHLFIINFEHFHLLFFVEGLCPELDHIRGTSFGPEIFGTVTRSLCEIK